MIDIIIKCSKDEPFIKSNTQKIRIKVDITEDPQIYKQNNQTFPFGAKCCLHHDVNKLRQIKVYGKPIKRYSHFVFTCEEENNE